MTTSHHHKAWLIRPRPNGILRISEFINESIIAIGWPGIGNLTNTKREKLKHLLSEPPYNLAGLALGNAYATIDIFVNQMDKEDLVLMPDGDDIYLGKITSDYQYNSSYDNAIDGFPHQRSVSWLADTSRQELPMALRSSLKVHRTAANLSQHAMLIDSIMKGKNIITDDPSSISTVEVTYPLRPNFKVSFKIPNDITRTEAQRLSSFFSSLYFADK